MLNSLSHLAISLSTACSSWFLYCKPSMSEYKIVSTVIWNILVPGVIISSGALNDVSVSGKGNFVVVKFLSVAGFNLIMESLLTFPILSQTVSSHILNGLFSINIAEACYTQITNLDIERPIQDNVIDFTNFFVGLRLLQYLYTNRNNYITFGHSTINCNYNSYFILCYTFWNLLFRIQLVQNSSTLIFFITSLGLPIHSHFISKNGDWLQIRGYTLLYLMISTFGLTPTLRIFPIYTKNGYDPEYDSQLFITKLQKHIIVKLIFLSLGFITSIKM